MTRVLPVGYQPVPAPEATAPYAHGNVGRDDLPALCELVAHELREHGVVVAVHPVWAHGEARRRLETVRAALDTVDLALYASPLPPLAGGALCGLAAAVATRLPEDQALVDVLPRLERLLVPVAQLSSVARLERPAPSVLQHLQSWWPPNRFAVTWWPEPAVRRLGKGESGVHLPGSGEWDGAPLDHLAVAAGDGTDTRWVEEVLAPALGAPQLLRVDLPPLANSYWGSRKLVEAVALPGDLERVLALLDSHPARPCPWCGRATGAERCPYCGVDREPPMPEPAPPDAAESAAAEEPAELEVVA